MGGGTTPPCTSCEPDAAIAVPCAEKKASSDWAGSYELSGSYNLSGPLSADRGLADIVSDALVQDIFDLLVPSATPSSIKDEARAMLENLVGQPVRDYINGSAPDSWLRSDPFMVALMELTAEVEFRSSLDLERPADGIVAGVEELKSFRVERGGIGYEIDANIVAGGQDFVPVLADWKAAASGSVLDVEDHEFSVRYGTLLNAMASEALGQDAMSAFTDRVTAAINCSAIVDTIAPSGELSVTVPVPLLPDPSFSVSAQPIEDACDVIVAAALDGAIGFFDIDSGITMGGQVSAFDKTCDGVADILESHPSFAGSFDIVGLQAIALQIAVDFKGTRGEQRAYADMRNALGTAHAVPVVAEWCGSRAASTRR